MSCEIKELDFENFGKCLSLTNGTIQAVVTIETGPRIIYFGLMGEKNIFYPDLNRRYRFDHEAISQRYGRGAVFFAYGGHRLWTSPERMPESYYPDNNPVIYAILPEGVSFTPPPQTENGLSLTLELIMTDGAKDMMVVHSAQNLLKEPMLQALSGCTMLCPGGTLIIPQNVGEENAYLPNRSYALWPYSKMDDSRIRFGEKFITLRQSSTVDVPFRMGTNNYSNWAAYLNRDLLFVKHYVHNRNAQYPDFNSSFEAYTDGAMMEIKTLSPLYRLQPGETIRHVENWSVQHVSNFCELSTDQEIQAMLDSV